MDCAGLGLCDIRFRKGQGSAGHIMGLEILVHDQQRHRSHIEQLPVVGVGCDHTVLNSAFQQQHDQQAIHHRQVAVDNLQGIQHPKHDDTQHDIQRQPLHMLISRHTALFQQHSHKIKAAQNKPGH